MLNLWTWVYKEKAFLVVRHASEYANCEDHIPLAVFLKLSLYSKTYSSALTRLLEIRRVRVEFFRILAFRGRLELRHQEG